MTSELADLRATALFLKQKDVLAEDDGSTRTVTGRLSHS